MKIVKQTTQSLLCYYLLICCIYPNTSWLQLKTTPQNSPLPRWNVFIQIKDDPQKIKYLLKKYVNVTCIHFIHEACQILLSLPIRVTVYISTVSAFIFLTLLIFPFCSLPIHNISSSVQSLALGIQHFLKPFTVTFSEMAAIMIHTDWIM
jgi:hypothetical protein